MEAQEFERAYWGDCLNTYDEETKHFAYARYMGLPMVGYSIGAQGASVLDIGGGPASMLLKAADRGKSVVVDPILRDVPQWVRDRYKVANIDVIPMQAEKILSVFPGPAFTEAWIYNVLQHVEDPEKVLANARVVAGRVRIFEWVDIEAYDGHPHELKATDLARWLGAPTRTDSFYIDEYGAVGQAFSGAFGV